MTRLARLLVRVPLRQLNLLCAGVLLIAGVLIWLLLLRAPLLALHSARAERLRLDQHAVAGPPLQQTFDQLTAEVGRLSQGFGPGDMQHSSDKMAVHLIAEMNRLGKQHGIDLGGVVPGVRRRVMVFDESTFDVNAVGSYAALLAWLESIEKNLPTLSVNRMEIQPSPGTSGLSMKVRIAVYQPQEER